jgi:thiamine-monophosphate kinase
MRRLEDVGEFGLIERIARMIGEQRPPRGVVLGPGDDAAILRPPAGKDLVVTTDALVEGVHFRWRNQAPRTVGRRALVVNLSDLAAMGALPLGCVVALAAPPALALNKALGLVAGLLCEAATHACPLVGGNVTAARETSIAITVFGWVDRRRALLRSGARPGDRVFVTGTLGGAALAVARAEREGTRLRKLPVPRLQAGRALSRMERAGACIDISDGLASDLEHLLEGARLGASIELTRVPRPRGFAAGCARVGLDPDRLVAAGGEDYELLFTLRAGSRTRGSEAALSRRLGVPVAEIGSITRGPGLEGLPRLRGWRHF